MKVVAIMGTNRKGRTQDVIEKIEAVFQSKGEPVFEYVYLRDKDIRFCVGCHNCIFNGEELCPLEDDVRGIENKMMEADAVIFATPAYMMNVTAIMKNFLDRVAYNCHRPKYFRKKALLVSNSSPYATKAAVKAMRDFADGAGFECMDLQTSFLPMPMKKEVLQKEWRKVTDAAQIFYDAVANPKMRKLNLGNLMQFSAMKTIARLLPDTMKADYAYFTELGAYDGSQWYVDPVKIPFFPKMMAKIAGRMMKRQMGKMMEPGTEGAE